jgi:two-component sensor histidine kinase
MAVQAHLLITSGMGIVPPGYIRECAAMTLLESVDLTVLTNLVLSITVVAISIWGYSRIGKPTPLYFGMAYVLFALSHFITLIGMNQLHATALIMLRTAGYILVAVGLFAIIRDIIGRQQFEWELEVFNTKLEDRVAERTQELMMANRLLIEEVRQRSFAEDRLKLALHEKEVLLKEIHHRVKNNLQIIISLLFLQAKKNDDPATTAALMDSQTRVKSMALVHEKLYQSENLSSIDFAGYLQNLVSNLMVAYGAENRHIRVSITAKDLPLTINTAIPLGLIMNELVSNTLKYAFPDGRDGDLSIEGHAQSDTMRIIVRDNGVGIPGSLDWRYTESLGLHLVQMLTRQLKGTVDLSRGGGTEFRFTIPVKEGVPS